MAVTVRGPLLVIILFPFPALIPVAVAEPPALEVAVAVCSVEEARACESGVVSAATVIVLKIHDGAVSISGPDARGV